MSSLNRDREGEPWCIMYGPNLYSYLAPCFLVIIIVKCNKLVIMEAQTFFYFSALMCFIDKELAHQYKLTLVEN
jgi:hypothetical protein